MSTAEATSTGEVPHQHLAEAGVWIARLHGESRSAQMEAGFREWLHASPMNARAFEVATETWIEAGNLRRLIPLAHGPRWQAARKPALVLSAIAAVIVGIGVTFLLLPPRGISTGVGEQRTLNLEDGTHISLNTSTRVIVHYDRKSRRIDLKNGEALFDVAKRSGWPFIVTAGGREVTALGTRFVVRNDDMQGLSVTLLEGKVSVAPASDRGNVILAPGERASFQPEHDLHIDRPELQKSLAWRRGQVILDDTPLALAVAEMNRYSSLRIVVDRPEAAALLINGLFQAGDSRSFAEAIAVTYGLKVVDHSDGIVLAGVPAHPASDARAEHH